MKVGSFLSPVTLICGLEADIRRRDQSKYLMNFFRVLWIVGGGSRDY